MKTKTKIKFFDYKKEIQRTSRKGVPVTEKMFTTPEKMGKYIAEANLEIYKLNNKKWIGKKD